MRRKLIVGICTLRCCSERLHQSADTATSIPVDGQTGWTRATTTGQRRCQGGGDMTPGIVAYGVSLTNGDGGRVLMSSTGEIRRMRVPIRSP